MNKEESTQKIEEKINDEISIIDILESEEENIHVLGSSIFNVDSPKRRKINTSGRISYPTGLPLLAEAGLLSLSSQYF